MGYLANKPISTTVDSQLAKYYLEASSTHIFPNANANERIADVERRFGLKRMCELSGLSKPTVIRGIRELKGKEKLRDEGRVRQAGGGRKPLQEHDPEAVFS